MAFVAVGSGASKIERPRTVASWLPWRPRTDLPSRRHYVAAQARRWSGPLSRSRRPTPAKPRSQPPPRTAASTARLGPPCADLLGIRLASTPGNLIARVADNAHEERIHPVVLTPASDVLGGTCRWAPRVPPDGVRKPTPIGQRASVHDRLDRLSRPAVQWLTSVELEVSKSRDHATILSASTASTSVTADHSCQRSSNAL